MLEKPTYSDFSRSRKVFSILVETDSHDTVCCIKRLLDAITMVHIDINVQYSIVIPVDSGVYQNGDIRMALKYDRGVP